MRQNMPPKSLVVSGAVVTLFIGIVAGFFAAHRVMGDMSEMKSSEEMKGYDRKDMSMKKTDMKGMPMDRVRTAPLTTRLFGGMF